jgi:DNA (cytosine-5)-methyltransferase 1
MVLPSDSSKSAEGGSKMRIENQPSSIELCAGAGGQALGLENAGFDHQAVVEIDKDCQATLKANRQHWNVIDDEEADVSLFNGKPYKGIDLLAGGLPCPPFSVAGKQLGKLDERDMFPAALRIIGEADPQAVMIENVRGFMDPRFNAYWASIESRLEKMGYKAKRKLFHASQFGVSQLRPRVAIIAIKQDRIEHFLWPTHSIEPKTVGEELYDLIRVNKWKGARSWRRQANDIAPTIVGGSKKHGGPDLGPTRAKQAWAKLGVDGMGIANEAPASDFVGMPRLTVEMVARLQGFKEEYNWQFSGRKTAAYRQVGNAFPPPVAQAIGEAILKVLEARTVYPARQISAA